MFRLRTLFPQLQVTSLLNDTFAPFFGPRRRRRKNSSSHSNLGYDSLEPKRALSASFPTFVNGQFTLGEPSGGAPYGLQNTFKLETRPNATKTIYLDFTGHYSTNNDWNHSIHFPKYDRDGNANTFNNIELIQIQETFQNVAEDFLPFHVNVTTKAPSTADLIKSHANDNRYGIRVVMTQRTNGFGDGSGGKAFRNSFTDNRDTPAFVFAKGRNVAAIIASHEIGHSLGLTHDGYYNEEYYRGHGSGQTSWGPLMGAPYTRNVTQWSNGRYDGATNQQDDIAIMTRPANGFGLRPDDAGNNRSSAHLLSQNGYTVKDWGIIGKRNDLDFYRFNLNHASDVSLRIRPFGLNPNLDILGRLYDSSGQQIALRNPHQSLDIAFNLRLDAGTYFISIDGTGKPGSYNDYGSLGFYTIKGEVLPVAESVIGESGVIPNLNHVWRTVQLQHHYSDPVVVVGPASGGGPDPTTVRVRNVTSTSFEVRVEEWDYLNEVHETERVGYLVMESGRHQLQDGSFVVAKTTNLNHAFKQVNFGMRFEARPVVMTQTMTTRDPATVTTRVLEVTKKRIQMQLQEQESSDPHHLNEVVGLIAFEKGQLESNNFRIEAFRTGTQVNHELFRINFRDSFSSIPVFLANMQTYRGHNTASLRYRQITGQSVRIFVEEEQSNDLEQEHNFENVGYVALNQGTILAIGQGGHQRVAPPPGDSGSSSNGKPNLGLSVKVEPEEDDDEVEELFKSQVPKRNPGD